MPIGKRNSDAFAVVRNRAEKFHLAEKLKKIDSEKKYEMRMFDITAKKFRSKFTKSSSESGNTEFKMYETHHPGFCYTRSGEPRNLQQISITPNLDYKHIYNLVFTNGVVDIQKILFLHLISMHKTENIVPPKKAKQYKEASPAERLLQRSKGYKIQQNNEKFSSLPRYNVVIEFNNQGEKLEPVITDGRFAARILMNEKLGQLIETVIDSLENTNQKKLIELLDIAQDPEELKTMFEERNHFDTDFVGELLENPLINSCDSFILTPPFKIKTVDVVIRAKCIEEIIRHIRKNVLQVPKKKFVIEESDQPAEDSPKNKIKTKMASGNTPSTSSKINSKDSRNNKKEEDKVLRAIFKKDLSDQSDNFPRLSLAQPARTKNFIRENILQAGKTKKIEYDTDDDPISLRSSRKSSKASNRSSRRSTVTLESKVDNISSISEETNSEKENQKGSDLDLKREDTDNPSANSSKPSVSIPLSTNPVQSRPHKTHHIKHSTCPACMNKWKQPLPSPKVPKIRRFTDKPVLKTNSLNRLKMLLSKEMYRLESYDRKYSSENSRLKRSALKREQMVMDDDDVHLSPMELARIAQEIKEKEAKTLLEKFLSDRI